VVLPEREKTKSEPGFKPLEPTIPPTLGKEEEKPAATTTTSRLLDAKRRAQKKRDDND
jgi:hypothetical protein